MPLDTSTSRRVDFVLDLICVHSYLAFTRFERAAERRRADGVRIQVAISPFQIAPDAPAQGEPLSDRHARDFGAEADRMTTRMAAIGAKEGLELDFERAVFVNTFRAHLLLAAAGSQARGEPMAERLFRAYFSEGLNIGDPATLDRLAAEVGVTPFPVDEQEPHAEELTAELERIRGLGVRQVPLIHVDTGATLSGARSEEDYLDALSQPARTH
ncbi:MULTISPECIES: DsbA family protein [unclassified Streptomyces]|uniref:DsbA family oxidoreductase n=1 Tax=unclassified Streptomyces TaxID=2593676 RepID=UPI001BAFA8A2|nr:MULTISPECIES: DsbA family protein [unclassified Streptomyces]MDH6454896.1 putative DsbA family dithiol-disulfide isomerase [Streptomyces sp. SAI-119]MDH6494550.1 putative DsbA family dithiol-disulfide isomerase [Streptomyces sp. SAI-149]QUC58310.1 DsbA family protein [Streptomyces sp. A2-16]